MLAALRVQVAWLRRVLDEYEWLIWMDLDCVFAHPEAAVLDAFDARFDAHFTPDSGSERRVNTGFFALRRSATPPRFFKEEE